MDIGRFVPRYQSMGALYPRSTILRDHIHEYYIEVVRLCHEILRHSKRSVLGQVASSLNDGLKIYQQKLEHWAVMIRDDVNSLMATSIEHEREENSRFRTAFLKRFSKEKALAQAQQKIRILDACSTFDHQTAWKQARKSGTTSSFLIEPKYQAWRDGHEPHTLVYTGILGSGKTVLMANIIDDLNIHVGTLNVPVVYFFCRYDTVESLQARTITGSLARQMLSAVNTSRSTSMSDLHIPEDSGSILRLLQTVLKPESTMYCVIDGLDECSKSEKDEILQHLRSLQDTHRLLICYSLRTQPNALNDLKNDSDSSRSVLTMPMLNPEIDQFIDEELERRLDADQLVLGDPTIIMDIREALRNGSQGMFLWAVLQIEVLCLMKTDDAIRRALKNLPTDLFETFSRIRLLYKRTNSQEDYQQKVLEFIYAACRPLTMGELQEALSVVPGDPIWNPAKLINNIFSLLECCGPLVIVDEEEETVRFAHYSIKQFLQSEPDLLSGARFESDSHRQMGGVIVTYLCYDVLGTQISTVERLQSNIQSIPLTVVESTLSPVVSRRLRALQLLRSAKASTIDLNRTIEGCSTGNRVASEFRFHAYAKAHWQQHVPALLPHPWSFGILCKLAAQRITGLHDIAPEYDQSPVGLRHMNSSLISLLLDPDYHAETFYQAGQSPLHRAAKSGLVILMQMLLKTEKFHQGTLDRNGWTPLSLAAMNGHENVVRLLVETNTKQGFAAVDDGPLLCAAANGHEAVVRHLLATHHDVNSKDSYGRTPLAWAAGAGHGSIVQLLLSNEHVQVDSVFFISASMQLGKSELRLEIKETSYHLGPRESNAVVAANTPLSWAAQRGHVPVVKLLLETRKVEVNFRDDRTDYTPLMYAAAKGNEELVNTLLGTDTVISNARNRDGDTPLSLAAANGHLGIVQRLLKRWSVNMDLDSLNHGHTGAVRNGHKSIAQLLMQAIIKADGDPDVD